MMNFSWRSFVSVVFYCTIEHIWRKGRVNIGSLWKKNTKFKRRSVLIIVHTAIRLEFMLFNKIWTTAPLRWPIKFHLGPLANMSKLYDK